MNIFSKIAIYFLISLLLLTPVINIPAPLFVKSLDTYAGLFFTLYLFLNIPFSQGKFKYKNILSLVLGSITILTAQMLLLETIYGYGDSTGLSTIPRMAVSIIIAYGCSQLLIKKYQERSLEFFIKIVIICAIIQGIVLWLTFLSNSFRDFMSVFFYRALDIGSDHLIELRTPGFVPTGGDGLSMNQALLAMIGLMGVYTYFFKTPYRMVLVTLLLFSMLSTTFAGRTGFYLSIIFAIFITSSHKSNFQVTRKAFKIIFVSIVIVALISLFSQQLGVYGQELIDEHGYEYSLVRLLRGFIDAQSTNQYSDATIQVLLTDMVVMPTEPLRFLVGNNDFGQLSGTAIGSDVGYFRMWHGIGLLGLMLFMIGIYIIPLVKIHKIKNKANNLFHKKLTKTSIAQFQTLLFVLIFGIIGHYKIFYLSTRIFVFVFFTLLFLTYYQYRQNQYQSINILGNN